MLVMVPSRDRRFTGVAVLWLVVLVAGAAAVVTRGSGNAKAPTGDRIVTAGEPGVGPGPAGGSSVEAPTSTAPAPAVTGAATGRKPVAGNGATTGPAAVPVVDPVGGPGATAFVDVAVATLWVAPDLARPIDGPSLTKPVDVRRWVSSMSVEAKSWLVGKLETQALYGERVTILDRSGAWAKVAVVHQPSSRDARGYPGWLPVVQLTGHQNPSAATEALVTRPTSALRDPADPTRQLMPLSYNTRLPVLSAGVPWVTVATPAGGRGLLASTDVAIAAGGQRPPAGSELVRSAQMFSGLPYLWAGTSSAGFDCSGLTSTVFAAHGIVIPRDADDQAAAGSPVDPSQMAPGDLLFYAGDGGRGGIYHVAMYAGNGLMVQSPATGRSVETVPVATSPLARDFWGARRYLAPPGAG